jgi:hypothetical protein
VCGYEYQFKGGWLSSALRNPLTARAALLVLMLLVCWLLGYLPTWRAAHGDVGVHFANGFVAVGLAGFAYTLSDLFSSRR